MVKVSDVNYGSRTHHRKTLKNGDPPIQSRVAKIHPQGQHQIMREKKENIITTNIFNRILICNNQFIVSLCLTYETLIFIIIYPITLYTKYISPHGPDLHLSLV